jgi:hypothetical protein
MSVDELREVIESNRIQVEELMRTSKVSCMDYQNRILLVLLWIIQYVKYSVYSSTFGVSEFIVSTVIKETLPILVAYFMQYIPNECISTKHSVLSHRIRYIIDGTVHFIRRPSVHQHKYYNGHWEHHLITTELLIDYDGYIVTFSTNYPGHLLDASCCRNNALFKHVVGRDFAISDTGYSRIEQKKIEHVNCFIKQCCSISKEKVFIHGPDLLIACVAVCCGMYNFKKLKGYYLPTS